MDAASILAYTADLARGVDCAALPRLMATGDSLAHRLRVTVEREGRPADLTGMTVTACFLRPDETMVVFTGSVSGSVAEATFPAACYRVSGPCAVAMRLTSGAQTSTIFWGRGCVTRTEADEAVDPEGRIPSLEELLSRLDQMAQATAAAQSAANAVAGMTVAAHTVPSGGTATVTRSDRDGHLHLDFGLVKGDPGRDGTGAGTVRDVAGVEPDEYGHVPLEIGGLNLLRRSTDPAHLPYSGTTAAKETGVSMPEWHTNEAIRFHGKGGSNVIAMFLHNDPDTYLLNQLYTMSVYIRNNGEKPIRVGRNAYAEVAPGESRRVSVTTKPTADESYAQIQFLTQQPGDDFDFAVWRPKIEYGNVATDWSPAPEDIESRVKALEERLAAVAPQ